jgi:predicted O-methyltransferase YrrM
MTEAGGRPDLDVQSAPEAGIAVGARPDRGTPRLSITGWGMVFSTIQAVGNWWAVVRPGYGRPSRNWNGAEVSFRLRRSQLSIRVTPRELLFTTVAIHAAMALFGSAAVPRALEELLPIEREINAELDRAYSADELHSRATGGLPEAKESVLYLLVRKYRPELVVETGVAQGISTRFLLEALHRNGGGRLVSVDLPNYDARGTEVEGSGRVDPVYVKRELGTGWLVPPRLRGRWSLHEGRAEEVLPDLEGRPDLFFHDSSHSYPQMMFEFEWAWPRLPPHGILVSDDIGWNHAFSDFIRARRREASVICDRAVGVVAKRPTWGSTRGI